MPACQCNFSIETSRKVTQRIVWKRRYARSDSNSNQTTSLDVPYFASLAGSTTPYFADSVNSSIPYFANEVNTTVPYFAAIDNSTIPYFADKETSNISSTTTPKPSESIPSGIKLRARCGVRLSSTTACLESVMHLFTFNTSF